MNGSVIVLEEHMAELEGRHRNTPFPDVTVSAINNRRKQQGVGDSEVEV